MAGLRQKNIDLRKQRILEGAKTIIAKVGHEKLSMRGLAADVGLSVVTLYNLYGDRDSIIMAVLYDMFGGMETAIAATPKQDDAVENCLRILKSMTDFLILNKAIMAPLVRGITGASGPFERGHVNIKSRSKEMVSPALSEVIEVGPSKGSVAADTLASLVYAHMDSEAEDWSMGAISDVELEQRIRLGALVIILSVISTDQRSRVETEIQQIEKRLAPKKKAKTPIETVS